MNKAEPKNMVAPAVHATQATLDATQEKIQQKAAHLREIEMRLELCRDHPEKRVEQVELEKEYDRVLNDLQALEMEEMVAQASLVAAEREAGRAAKTSRVIEPTDEEKAADFEHAKRAVQESDRNIQKIKANRDSCKKKLEELDAEEDSLRRSPISIEKKSELLVTFPIKRDLFKNQLEKLEEELDANLEINASDRRHLLGFIIPKNRDISVRVDGCFAGWRTLVHHLPVGRLSASLNNTKELVRGDHQQYINTTERYFKAWEILGPEIERQLVELSSAEEQMRSLLISLGEKAEKALADMEAGGKA